MPKRPPSAAGKTVWERPDPSRRQRPPACTREQITTAAIAIADQEGLEAVTMRRLGSELGIAPTSLYWYFATKSELHELIADAIIARIEVPKRPSGDWRADLTAIAWSTLALARRHPWFSQLAFQKQPGPSTNHYGERALASFVSEELDPTAALNCLAALNNYVFGFAGRATQQPPDANEPLPMIPNGPLAQERRARALLTTDDSFAFGLTRMLDGIERYIAGQHESGSHSARRG